jgi:Domain of unknown function (DUF4062)
MQPRYQVFLSSTFRDLREERQSALEAILELGHFPAGMEAFPAADATPWELIKTIIADSDYYVLIVGGKYGSTGPEGISYTEMEFNLAVELEKPILAFVHGEPEQIPAGKIELDTATRQRLDQFRNRITQRLCKHWTNKENLKASVLLALVHAIRTKPAFGWVRNEGLENQELLKRLASLQERYDSVERELQTLRATSVSKADSKKFQGLDSLHTVTFTYRVDNTVHGVDVPLSELFFYAADAMLVPCNESQLRSALTPAVIACLSAEIIDTLTKYESDKGEALRLNLHVKSDSLANVLRQLLAIGLVEPQLVLRQSGTEGRTSTTSQRCWLLTSAGRAKYLEKRAIPAGDG